MKNDMPPTIHRSDYTPLAWTVDRVDLHFSLDPDDTLVTSTLHCVRNGDVADGP
jgi:aminopeptidase N